MFGFPEKVFTRFLPHIYRRFSGANVQIEEAKGSGRTCTVSVSGSPEAVSAANFLINARYLLSIISSVTRKGRFSCKLLHPCSPQNSVASIHLYLKFMAVDCWRIIPQHSIVTCLLFDSLEDTLNLA